MTVNGSSRFTLGETTHQRKHTGRSGRRSGGRREKVCAVRYVDESVMTSMPEWTELLPQEYTDTHTHTHWTHRSTFKPALETEHTAA